MGEKVQIIAEHGPHKQYEAMITELVVSKQLNYSYNKNVNPTEKLDLGKFLKQADFKPLYEANLNGDAQFQCLVNSENNPTAVLEAWDYTSSKQYNIIGYFHDKAARDASWEQLVKCVTPLESKTDAVPISFWTMGAHGPDQRVKMIDTDPWDRLLDNYSPGVRDAVGALTKLTAEQITGKMMLWYGEPGSGKTYAIRSLLRYWSAWCNFHYIIDVDRFFGINDDRADYLTSVLFKLGSIDDEMLSDEDYVNGISNPRSTYTNSSSAVSNKWNVIILEDAGELISMDARAKSGQALSRLLNITDGLLGQGMKLMILITTNEELEKLHPAVSRAGRCLSKIQFPQLTPIEAQAWMTQHKLDPTKAANKSWLLSDLYELVNKSQIASTSVHNKIGF